MIKKLPGGRFRLFTADGSRPLGPPESREAALRRERQAIYWKHVKGGK